MPRARIELATQGFSVLRSTTELPRQKPEIRFRENFTARVRREYVLRGPHRVRTLVDARECILEVFRQFCSGR